MKKKLIWILLTVRTFLNCMWIAKADALVFLIYLGLIIVGFIKKDLALLIFWLPMAYQSNVVWRVGTYKAIISLLDTNNVYKVRRKA